MVIGTSAMVLPGDHRRHRLQVRVGRRAHPPAVRAVVSAGHDEVDRLAARRLDHRDAQPAGRDLARAISATIGPSGIASSGLADEPDRLEELLDPHEHPGPDVAACSTAMRAGDLVVGGVGMVDAGVDGHARGARRRADDADLAVPTRWSARRRPGCARAACVSPTMAVAHRQRLASRPCPGPRRICDVELGRMSRRTPPMMFMP